VRVVLGTLVLMKVQKRRLQELKRQHHLDGDARPDTHIVAPAKAISYLIDRKLTARPEPSDYEVSIRLRSRRSHLWSPAFGRLARTNITGV
jgi:hypothetical protein